MKDCALAQKAFDNHTHENLYKVYSAIFGTSRLYTHIDHWGIMRGTENLELKTGTWFFKLGRVDCNVVLHFLK